MENFNKAIELAKTLLNQEGQYQEKPTKVRINMKSCNVKVTTFLNNNKLHFIKVLVNRKLL
jgi:hypothetical protein